MKIYIAAFQDRHYPEDNEIFGAYMSEHEAETCIANRMAMYKNEDFEHHKRLRHYYEILETELEGI